MREALGVVPSATPQPLVLAESLLHCHQCLSVTAMPGIRRCLWLVVGKRDERRAPGIHVVQFTTSVREALELHANAAISACEKASSGHYALDSVQHAHCTRLKRILQLVPYTWYNACDEWCEACASVPYVSGREACARHLSGLTCQNSPWDALVVELGRLRPGAPAELRMGIQSIFMELPTRRPLLILVR